MARNLDWYLDEARRRAELDSDRKLSARLDLSGPAINQMRTARTWPSDPTMVLIADLAGVPAEEALLDLNQWRCKDPAARAVYERMASIIAKTAAALLLAFVVTGTQPAHAAIDAGATVYYGKYRIWVFS